MTGGEDSLDRPRLNSSDQPDQQALSITVSRDGLARFERFRLEECARMTKVFAMPAADTDGWPLADENHNPLTDENGNSLLMAEAWACIFDPNNLPRIGVVGIEFTIDFGILVLPL